MNPMKLENVSRFESPEWQTTPKRKLEALLCQIDNIIFSGEVLDNKGILEKIRLRLFDYLTRECDPTQTLPYILGKKIVSGFIRHKEQT